MPVGQQRLALFLVGFPSTRTSRGSRDILRRGELRGLRESCRMERSQQFSTKEIDGAERTSNFPIRKIDESIPIIHPSSCGTLASRSNNIIAREQATATW